MTWREAAPIWSRRHTPIKLVLTFFRLFPKSRAISGSVEPRSLENCRAVLYRPFLFCLCAPPCRADFPSPRSETPPGLPQSHSLASH